MLRLTDLTYRIGGQTVLDGASAAIPAGARVGLVGRNGAGKTTLLDLIAGRREPDAGAIAREAGARVGLVAQEAPAGRESPIAFVLAADRERTRLLEEAEGAAAPERIAEIHDRLAEIGAHRAAPRAAEILAGLGITEAAQHAPCAQLSGGLRMRVALAALLFTEPDLLLLDEPTNHLDLEATLWLETFLMRYRGTVVIVSHDRALLNKVPRRILHLERGRLTPFSGNFDAFERTLAERRGLAAKEREKTLAQRRRIQAFVDRFRAKATKARQAQSRLKMLERLGPVAPIDAEHHTAFDLPDPEELPSPLLALDRVAVGYDGAPVLKALTLRIDMDDRIALVGANGNGKSTLARLLAGRLAPEAGEVARNPKLRVGYFAQHQLDELDATASPFLHMVRLAPDGAEPRLRAHLGRFGFPQDMADRRVAVLSGGEKARLVLALITWRAPQLLILDEPTNHLDIDSRGALTDALNAFEGAAVLISHDATLIESCADRLWLVADGTCRTFDGDLADYERAVMAGRRPQRTAPPGDERRAQRRAAAEARAALAPLRRAADEADRRLAALTAEKSRLEAKLAEPAIYDGPSEALQDLLRRRGEIAKALEDAEAAWLDAHAKLEAAGK